MWGNAESWKSQGGFARDMISWSKIAQESSALATGNARAEVVSGGVCMACMLDSRRWERTVWTLSEDWWDLSRLRRWAWIRWRSVEGSVSFIIFQL